VDLLSPARVAGVLRRSVGAATAIAQDLFEARRPAVARRLSGEERRTETVAAALFAISAAVLALAQPGHLQNALSAGLLVVCYALVRRVRFQFGPGLIRPTQLVFVPMVFLMPAAWIPALVGLGSVLGELPDIAWRKAHPERLCVVLSDAWYAVGPALVIVLLASGSGADASWGVIGIAAAALVATDLVASSLREWFGAGIRPAALVPVLGFVYLIDAALAPIGYLAVLARDAHEHAYLLAIAPAVALALLALERTSRIAHELELERAFRRATSALDARTQDLRRQCRWLRRPDRRMGEAVPAPEDRATLERELLTAAAGAVHADCGRLSVLAGGARQTRAVIGSVDTMALDMAERSGSAETLSLAVGSEHVLTLAREGAPFSPVERELVEHLAAQSELALENLELGELMRRTEAELRAILEAVADAVVVEDAQGRVVYRNPAADALLGDRSDLACTLSVSADLLPGRLVLAGDRSQPLVVQHGDRRWSRVKSTPVHDGVTPRLAVSVVEDITAIKRAEEAHRFLAESSRLLASSPDLEETLPKVERLATSWFGGDWTIDLHDPHLDESPPDAALRVPIRTRGGVAGTITRSVCPADPLEVAVAEDLGLRVGAAVDIARLCRTRAVVTQALQTLLLPQVPPEIPGLETAGLYRPAGAPHPVGGDFYDVFSTGPNEWFLVIGDVRGESEESVAVSALARDTIRAAATDDRSPTEVLRRLNAVMLGRRAPAFAGIACVRLDVQPGSVVATVACGGHPAPRVLRATGVVEALGARGSLIGIRATVALESHKTRLRSGDALILYTNQLTDAAAPAVWTPEQLHTIIAGAIGQTAEGIVEHIAATVEGPLRDNLALLAVRVEPEECPHADRGNG
jgi:PAS domain-containing protein